MIAELAQRWRWLAAGLRRVTEGVVVALFALIVAVFAFSIASRYLFNRPVIWSDEVLVLAMVWCTFLAGALILTEREQVVFDLFYERCTPQGRRVMLILGSLLLAAILSMALPAIVSYTRFLWRERTNVLELRLDFAYACFVFFIVAVIVRRLIIVLRLIGSQWRAQLEEIAPPLSSSAPD